MLLQCPVRNFPLGRYDIRQTEYRVHARHHVRHFSGGTHPRPLGGESSGSLIAVADPTTRVLPITGIHLWCGVDTQILR